MSGSNSKNDDDGDHNTMKNMKQKQEEEEEEDLGDVDDEESYRRRMYGTADPHDKDGGILVGVGRTKRSQHQHQKQSSSSSSSSNKGDNSSSSSHRRRRRPSSFRRFSKQLSKQSSNIVRRSSSFVGDSMPETPAGWTLLVTTLLSAAVGYEVRLQHQLTAPPAVFYQQQQQQQQGNQRSSSRSSLNSSFMDRLYQKMTQSPGVSILSRNIQPSLFVGTRGVVSSTAAYLMNGPSSSSTSRKNRPEFLRFREIMTMTQDGAQLALDWEVPSDIILPEEVQHDADDADNVDNDEETTRQRIRHLILNGPISRPVVIILHGINNDGSFGYMRSLQRTYVKRGWVAACMNFRGCGGVKMTTPRGYNGAYTGDIRSVVQQISSRMMNMSTSGTDLTSTTSQPSTSPMIFLVGNSLGANILTKYLGEEGAAGTLPSCVSGAASLGNPLVIHSGLVMFPFNVLMGLGVKRINVENWRAVSSMKDFYSRHCLRNAMLAPTIAAFDNAMAPNFVRNDNAYPFGWKPGGYVDGDSYWFDASSYRYLTHINIPFLNLTARDDFLVSKPSRNKLGFCISNPNVMVVETRCGGHLGWQESSPDNSLYGSYADACTSDFFDAIIQCDNESTPEDKKARAFARTADRIEYVDPALVISPPMDEGKEIKNDDRKTNAEINAAVLSSIQDGAVAFSKDHLSTRSRL